MRFGRLAALAVAASLTAGAAYAQIAADPEKASQFNALIERAQAAIGHWAYNTELDVFRAKSAAGFELSKAEQVRMGEMALTRCCPVEAEAALAPLATTGEFGGPQDPDRRQNAMLFERVQRDAEAARAGDLLKSERWAARQHTGEVFVATGEAQFATGNYEKALDLIEKGIAKGGFAKEDAPFAQLQLGIAQYRSGKVSEARSTWRAIRSERGAQELAQAWLIIAGD